MIALLTGGVVFAGVVGSFSRYSWPATAGILGLGTVVVLIGWHGPVRARPDGGRAAGLAEALPPLGRPLSRPPHLSPGAV